MEREMKIHVLQMKCHCEMTSLSHVKIIFYSFNNIIFTCLPLFIFMLLISLVKYLKISFILSWWRHIKFLINSFNDVRFIFFLYLCTHIKAPCITVSFFKNPLYYQYDVIVIFFLILEIREFWGIHFGILKRKKN